MRCNPLFLFPALLLCGLPLYPWLSLPGSGLTVTANLLAWSVAGLWGLWLCFVLSWQRLRFGLAGRMLFGGLVLLNLPAVWAPVWFPGEAGYRLAATAALALLLWVLLQFPVRGGQRRGLYTVIVIAALIQALLCFWQALLPVSAAHWLHFNPLNSGGRATGGFGQANLAGSFLATGMLCALWLSVSLDRQWGYRLMRGSVLVLCAAIMLSESRTAWLGTVVGTCVLLWSAEGMRSRLLILTLLAAGLLAGYGALMLRPTVLPVPVPAVAQAALVNSQPTNREDRLVADRRSSESERLALVRGSWALIVAHPLTGQGIGTFETAFPVIMSRLHLVNPFTVTVAYPHNEVLYVWSEGGLVALTGLFCWLVLWGLPFRSSHRSMARGAFTLPLMAHVMTEYPFYLSALHGILMVLLLWLALPAASRRCTNLSVRRAIVPVSLALGCSVGVAFMISGLQSAWRIRTAEEAGLSLPLTQVWNRFAQPERLQFDRAVTDLMQFNQTGDSRWLIHFQSIATDWLARHNDPNLTDTMMRIAAAQQNHSQAEAWRQRGCLSFHTDPRFQCETTSSPQSEYFQ